MRIRSVTAHAFGALSDKTLHLADGLNVIVGRNGTGKSTWHAALYGALCGFLPEARFPADARFRKRRPRHQDSWRVSAELVLDSGQHVLISQDLLDPSNCTVIDEHSGADLSRLIRHDGVLDATTWLGLDRRSFAATAFIEQAYGLLAPGADSSDRPLQRAVATGGGGATVSEAIGRIERHRARVVGDPGDPYAPMAAAVGALGEARAATENLQTLRHEREVADRTLFAVRHQASQARERVRAARLAMARDRVRRLDEQLTQATAERGTHQRTATALAAEPNTPVRPALDTAARTRVEQAEQRLWEARVELEKPDPQPSVTESVAASGGSDAPTLEPTMTRGRLWAALAGGTVLFGLIALVYAAVVGSVPVAFVGGVVTLGGLFAAALAVFPGLRGAPRAGGPRVLVREIRTVDPAETRAQRQRRYDRAWDDLSAALLAVGIPPGTGDEIFVALEEYRQLRDRPAAPARPGVSPVELAATMARLDTRIADLQVAQETARTALAELEPESAATFAKPSYDPQAFNSTGYQAPSLGPSYAQPVAAPTAEEFERIQRECTHAIEAETAAQNTITLLDRQIGEAEPVAATLDRARAEHHRLTRLNSVFETTVSRLESARTAVHQQVARELEYHVGDWLRDVTDQRYTDVRIDPETLDVFISGPNDPEVNAFDDSQGTADQVQLLLRLALFLRERDSDRGPLLLDDVIAHGDPERAAEVIRVLGKIAERGHQVVLFTTQPVQEFPATIRLVGTTVEPAAEAEAVPL